MMHIDCYLTALEITTNARPRKIDDEEMRCPKHCPHYKEHMKKENPPVKEDGRKRPPEKRPSEEDEMGMKQPAKHAQASAYRRRTDSSSEEDDRKQPAKKSGEIDLSEDDTTSDEDDGGGKQRSRKSDTWNCHDGDLMPYDGGHSSSEEVSCSSMDYSSDDNSDDDHDDDDDDGNNNGQGASSKATTTTTKKKAAGAGNETAAEERTVATATTETAAAAAAGSTASTSLSTIEDAAIAFAQRGFTLDGSELKKGDKLNKVGGVVCRLLREHPDPDGENQMDPSDISQMFDGWVNPAWLEIAFETWQVLYEMLDKKKEKSKAVQKLGAYFQNMHASWGVSFTLNNPLARRMLVKDLVDIYEKAARDARRTQSAATTKKAQQQKKAKKNLKGGLEENTAPRTVSDNAQSFVTLLTNSLQHGQRDLRANNIEETPNNIAGAGAAYLSRAQISDDQRHFISQQMGEPTADLGDDVHISELQRAGADHRYYNNRLHRISMGGGASVAPAVAAPAAPAPREGMRETTPPPTSQQNWRSTRSSTSTYSDRKERIVNRVFKQIVHKGTDLQEEGTPATKKRRSKRALRALSAPGNNVIKMRVTCEAVDETPERGLSQRLAYDIVNSSDVEDDDEQYKKKKSMKKKKKNHNNDNDDEDNNSSK